MSSVPVERQIADLEKAAAMLRSPTPTVLKRLLGNAAVIAHNIIRLNFMRSRTGAGKPWRKLSPLTMLLKKGAGHGRRRGRASGALEKAIGPPITGEGSRVSSREFVKWRLSGFTFGENLPKYARYFSAGWNQKFTPKQAAYLTFKAMEAQGIRTGGSRRRKGRKGVTKAQAIGERLRKRKDRKSDLGSRRKRRVKRSGINESLSNRDRRAKVEEAGFDYALWKGLQKKTRRSPSRELLHINNQTVDKMKNATRSSMVDIILHPNL